MATPKLKANFLALVSELTKKTFTTKISKQKPTTFLKIHFPVELPFKNAQAQRNEGLRALLLVIVDAVQTDSLKYECLKVVCNLVDACPSIATRMRPGRRSASLAMGCSAATT